MSGLQNCEATWFPLFVKLRYSSSRKKTEDTPLLPWCNSDQQWAAWAFPPQNTLPIVWLSIHTKDVHVCTCVGSVASTVSASLQTRGLQPARFLCPWASPGENTGVGCHALLQGIFPTHGSNPGPLAVQADSLSSELPGKPQETWGEFQGGL